jgi:hypothetical protein
MKIQYDFFFCFQRLGRMNENKNMFFVFLFNVLMKTGILISDLYFYNIKIQTNIKQNLIEKYAEKS